MEYGQEPATLCRSRSGTERPEPHRHVPVKRGRGAGTEPQSGALLRAALKCMSCASPNDEQSCQTRSLSQLIISNEGRVSASPRSWAAASHSAQLQTKERIGKCHCAGLATKIIN